MNLKVNLLALKDEDIVSYGLVRASLLQKLIRRSMLPEALWVVDLYRKDEQLAGLKRRLLQIAVEDIGLAQPRAIEYLYQEPDVDKQITFLCRCFKNREIDQFMLMVSYEPTYFKSASAQMKKEGLALYKLLKISELWFNNRRVKEYLINLQNEFNNLSKDHPFKETIDLAGKLYIDLTRHNVHGAKVVLALISLLVTREVEEQSFPSVEDIPEMNPLLEVPSFALDRHTPFGKKLNRDFIHWGNEGAFIDPKLSYAGSLQDSGLEKYPLEIVLEVLKKSK